MRLPKPALALVLPLLLALAAPAGAAPMSGAAYGGGLVPDTVYKPRDAAHLSVLVSPDGQHATVVGQLLVLCNHKRSLNQQIKASGEIGLNGLSLETRTRNYLYAITGAKPRARAKVDIGFDGATAAGTVRVRAAFKSRGKAIRCDSTLTVQLRAVPADTTAPGAAVAGADYLGTGSAKYRGAPVSIGLKVSADGRKVVDALYTVPFKCGPYTDFLPNYGPPMTIRADGSFAKTEHLKTLFDDGASTRTTLRLRGRFTHQGATGTYRANAVSTFKRGKPVRCSSGTISWSAAR